MQFITAFNYFEFDLSQTKKNQQNQFTSGGVKVA